MGYRPVPVHPDHLLQYAAFLARTLKAASVKSYLNIVGLLHKEFDLPNPLQNNWSLKSLITGINRCKGAMQNQKQPLTPELLLRLHDQLDVCSSFDASFWAICLVAFYGMFRKSHLLPTVPSTFDSSKHLTKGDFKIFHWGTLITIRWSKTIQFRERVVEILLPRIPGSMLCPTTAVTKAFRLTAPVSTSTMQAFNWVDRSRAVHVFTYSAFIAKLRAHLSTLGVDPLHYAGHSFRRGGGGGGAPSPFVRGPHKNY